MYVAERVWSGLLVRSPRVAVLSLLLAQILAFLPVLSPARAGGPTPSAAAGAGPEATELDLTGWRRTFTEDFDALDVSAWGPGSRWIAHVPWGGDFGDAKFTDPAPGFPFRAEGGVLRIEARKVDGRWRSGLIASVDRKFQGFAQRYGYFEIRARMPDGEGVWPAFWLVGVDRSQSTAEIDVLEYYGAFPNAFKSVAHVWNRGPKKAHYSDWIRTPAPGATERFNTYGVEVDEAWITFYFNRRPVWRTATQPEHRQPLFIMANLALGGGFPIERTPDPSVFLIDYIHVYERP